MKTFNFKLYIAVLLVGIYSLVSCLHKNDYVTNIPEIIIEDTQGERFSAANQEPNAYFSFTINANGTLYWYMDNE